MTAQISDCFKYKGKKYNLVAISESMGFKPSDYGLKPQGVMTSCWRGYWCEYEIKNKDLMLNSLHIHTEDERYPDFNGVPVTCVKNNKAKGPKCGDGRLARYIESVEDGNGYRLYENIDLPIRYSGRILVGNKFLNEYYIHMGFQQPYAYKELLELIFEEGKLIDIINHSKIAKRIRKKIGGTFEFIDDQDLLHYIKECFSTDYAKKAWWIHLR